MKTYSANEIHSKYRTCFEHVAAKLRKKYFWAFWNNPDDFEAFELKIHSDGPALLLAGYKTSWDDLNHIQAFLYKVFKRQLLPLVDDALAEGRCRVDGRYAEYLFQNGTGLPIEAEDSFDYTSLSVHLLLKEAPSDVQALCLAFLEHGSWAEAAKSLGWKKRKRELVINKVKLFFTRRYDFGG